MPWPRAAGVPFPCLNLVLPAMISGVFLTACFQAQKVTRFQLLPPEASNPATTSSSSRVMASCRFWR